MHYRYRREGTFIRDETSSRGAFEEHKVLKSVNSSEISNSNATLDKLLVYQIND